MTNCFYLYIITTKYISFRIIEICITWISFPMELKEIEMSQLSFI